MGGPAGASSERHGPGERRRPGDRPYHVLVAAAALGLGLGESRAPLVALCAGAALTVLAILRAPRLGALAAAVLVAGAVVGQMRLAAIDEPASRLRDGERVNLRAHLLAAPRPGPFGATAEIGVTGGGAESGSVEGARLHGARLLLRIPRWAPLPSGARPGRELRLEGRTAELANSGFGAYLRSRGVAGELLLDRARLTGGRRTGIAGLLDRMRARAERAVAAGMSPEGGALLRGMVLGQDERIGESVREDFRASGLAHLLAVSGQNVMLLAALALPFLIFSGLGMRGRLVVLGALIALYIPLAGAGPSLQRAGVMGLAGLAAMAASRPASRSYALLLAAAVTLAWNPRAWTDPAWQLSFAAVAGILVLGVPLGRTLRRAADELLPGEQLRRGVRESLRWAARAFADGIAITLAATVATAPLLAHHFGSVPLAGLPANLLALPAVAPAMWLGMLKIALGQAGAPEELAERLGSLAAVPVDLLAWLAERFAHVPMGQVPAPLGSPSAVAAAYAGLGALGFAAARGLRPIAPHTLEAMARWRRLPARVRAGVVACLAVALILAAGAALRTPAPPDRLTITFLDVGQGDATLIQHPAGPAILFDGGPPEAGVARLLRRAGVSRLALVVATHASRDHHGGLLEVLRRFPVDALLDGGDGSGDAGFTAVLREAARRGVQRIPATAPLSLKLAGGGLSVDVLSPPPRPPGPSPEDPNPRAVVALVRSSWFDLLLSADAESETLIPLDLPDVDAMKVPHHGSADPGLPGVLAQLAPELAAIEVGPNTYGHPTEPTLRALDAAGVRTYRTDRDGTVTLTVEPSEMSVRTER